MLIHVPWTMVFAGRVYELLAITIYTNCGFGTGTETEDGFDSEEFSLSSVFPRIEPHIPPHHRASQPKVERCCFDLIESWASTYSVNNQVLVVWCLLFCRTSWLPVALHLSHGYRHLEFANKQESHGWQSYSHYTSYVCC